MLSSLSLEEYYLNKDKPTFPYKRGVHFDEFLIQFEAKLSTENPSLCVGWRKIEETLKKTFDMVQDSFEKHCPTDFIGFFPFSYILHKFFQLLELDEYVKYFPLLELKQKLIIWDGIWEKICLDCNLDFYPSV